MFFKNLLPTLTALQSNPVFYSGFSENTQSLFSFIIIHMYDMHISYTCSTRHGVEHVFELHVDLAPQHRRNLAVDRRVA